MSVEDMNNERNGDKVTKESFKDYTYVMVSTLNQMVNYIPLKHFTFKEVINITIEDSLYGDNAKWDKNLAEVLGNGVSISPIPFKQSEITNLTEIKKRFDSLKDKKVFWNITGGQRPFVLAVQQIAKKDDVICYLEGNNSQMVLLQSNQEINDMPSYNLDDLSIETALKLMGFETNKIQSDENHLDDDSISKFITEYKNIANKLRDLMIETNKKMNESDAIAKLQSLELPNEDAIKTVIKWGYAKNKSTPFGYILEEMTHYFIKQSKYYKHIAELKTNVRLYSDTQTKQMDEFDIALLTKNGKFMIFECKSGGMEGDVAKSTKYSTYAISGAYGLPILITPLLESEIEKIDKLDKDTYEYIQNAVKSAKRAGLEVWGIDEIATKIEKYINQTGETK